jgi:hypothetical protein
MFACGQRIEFHETKLTANQSANPPMLLQNPPSQFSILDA